MKQKLGLLFLGIIMAFLLIPTKASAAASDIDYTIDADGMLSWQEYAGASRYYLEFSESANINMLNDSYAPYYNPANPRQFNLKHYLSGRRDSGTYTFKLFALDSGNSVISNETTVTYSFTTRATAAPVITTTALDEGGIGLDYYFALGATGESTDGYRAYTSWSLVSGTLPAGLTLSELGYLRGTPTESGTFSITIKATNSEGSDQKAFTLTINSSARYKLTGLTVNASELSISGEFYSPVVTSAVATWESTTPNTSDYSISPSYLKTEHGDNVFSTSLWQNGADYYIDFTIAAADNGLFDFSGLSATNFTITLGGFKNGVCTSIEPIHFGGEYKAVVHYKVTRLNTYTVEYDTRSYTSGPGASAPTVSSAQVKEGECATPPSTPTCENFIFAGWYTGAACTEAFNFSNPITANTTVFAKWEGHTTHTYDREVIEARYLKSLVDCEHAAVYYKSCECGKSSAGTASEDTFTNGLPLGHVSSLHMPSGTIVSQATCTDPERQYAVCDHVYNYITHYNPSDIVESAPALGHSFTYTPSTVIAVPETATTPAYYYVKCDRCNEVSTTLTITLEEARAHLFPPQAPDNTDDGSNEPDHHVSDAILLSVLSKEKVELYGITTLSLDEMQLLKDNPLAVIVLNYTYLGRQYKVTLTGKDVEVHPTVLWYGPLYLARKYGNTAAINASSGSYVIQKGDTLSSIAMQNKTTVNALMSLNSFITNRNSIRSGWILRLK